MINYILIVRALLLLENSSSQEWRCLTNHSEMWNYLIIR